MKLAVAIDPVELISEQFPAHTSSLPPEEIFTYSPIAIIIIVVIFIACLLIVLKKKHKK